MTPNGTYVGGAHTLLSVSAPPKPTRYGVARYWGWVMLVVIVALSSAGFELGFVWWLGGLTVVGYAAAAFGLLRPVVGLFGMSLLCTLDAVIRPFLSGGGQFLRWNAFNYWLLLVIVLHQGLIRRFRDTQSRLFLGFVVLLTFELVFSARISRGAQHILGIATIFGLLVYFVRAGANDRAWYWQGVLSGTAAALGGLLFNLQQAQLMPLNRNVWALVPETGIFALCLAFGFARDKREESVLVSLAAVNMVWAFLSGSRGGLFIASVALLFFLVSMKGVTKRLAYVAGAMAVAVVVSGWFADQQDATVRRLERMWSADETADSRTSGRSSLALGGWHIFLAHPLGVGTGGSELAWAKLGYVEGISDFMAGEEFSLHSGWIKVLAENGLPGFVFFAALIASFALTGWKTGNGFLRLLGCAVTVTLSTAFLSTEFQGKGFWFFSAGALTLLNRRHMLAALAGGRRSSVWWVRPAVPTHALRPRAVGSADQSSATLPKPIARPRPLV